MRAMRALRVQFAGKTTELLRQARQLQGKGHRVQLVKSSKDTRYLADAIVTHKREGMHDTMPAVAVGSLMELQVRARAHVCAWWRGGLRRCVCVCVCVWTLSLCVRANAQQPAPAAKHLATSPPTP